MRRNISKIIFCDIGGVLLSNGWGHISRQAAAKKFSIDYQEMDIIHNFIFNVYEIGRITLDEYLDTIVFHQPRNFSKTEFKDFMFSQSTELPEMLKWLKNWKKDNPLIPVIAINNEGKELNEFRINKFGLHDCFDAFISSCEVGLRKPDPEIFTLALGVAQAAPKNCLYFDDRPMVVDAARKMGIDAHQHQHFSTTKNIIEKNLNKK